MLGGNRHVVQSNRSSGSKMEVLNFAGPLPQPLDPEAGLDSNPKVSAQAARMGQQGRIRKALLCQRPLD